MKRILLTALMSLCCHTMAEDGFYHMEDLNKFVAKVEDNQMVLKVNLKKVPIPKAIFISACSDPASRRKYRVTVGLAEEPKKQWNPVLSIDGKAYFRSVSIGSPIHNKRNWDISIGCDDPKEATALAKSLAVLLKIPEKKVLIEKGLSEKTSKPSKP